MTEAQRSPLDFDGIIAGGPGISETSYYLDMLWDLRALQGNSHKPILYPSDLRFVHKAVLQQCDLDDGANDGVVGNPKKCHFSPASLVCKPGQKSRCLTASQAEAVQKVYDGPLTSLGKNTTPGGASVGSELTWTEWFYGQDGREPFYTMESVADMFRYRAFVPDPGPAWKLSDFDFDRDPKRLGMMEALYFGTNPDLRKFKAAGGKLIIYQGWEDPLAIPDETIDYYSTVEKTMGGQAATQEFARLFMVPGMDHCTGSRGAFAIDYLTYLEDWVEKGRAPDMMVGAHVKRLTWVEAFQLRMPLAPGTPIDFTRPVFPYPVAAKYSGSGDVTHAQSWIPEVEH
jgi:Tannase and feruloyl esterase